MELISRANEVHRRHHAPGEVQVCVLLSIKTGGCPEDCGYCPQAARYHAEIEIHPLLDVPEVLEAARQAREAGATRFCMGAAWREVKDGPQFDRVCQMVEGIKQEVGGLEVCCTLGMLNDDQAVALKHAGLDAYNHNLDTSPEYYDRVITTRTYKDRLETLDRVRQAGISVCCGGIIGMGETEDDRIGLLHALATLARATRVGPRQRPGGRRRHADGRAPEGRDLGDGPHDRHGSHPVPPGDGAALGRADSSGASRSRPSASWPGPTRSSRARSC